MTIRINGEAIQESAINFELDRLVKFYSQHMSAAEVKNQMDVLKKKAREQTIGTKLLIDEAARLDIRVPAEDVEARMKTMMENAGGVEAFRKLLAKQGLAESLVRSSIEQGRRLDLLVAQITSGVSDPTEDELLAHFKEHEEEFTKSDRVQVQHILIKPVSREKTDKDTARSRLMEIRRKIEEGADFADLAAAHSDCPSGRRTGGSLGWVSEGMAVTDMEKTILSLKVGEVSEIVETRLGLHIFKKTAHEEGGKAQYSEVAEKIRDFLRHAKRGAVISNYIEDLKKKAVIEEED